MSRCRFRQSARLAAVSGRGVLQKYYLAVTNHHPEGYRKCV